MDGGNASGKKEVLTKEPGISREGVEVLRVILGQEKTRLTEVEKNKMLQELVNDPKIFDPVGNFKDSKTDVTVRIPTWLWYYLDRRKRVTGLSISKQMANIVAEYTAKEILEIIGEEKK